MSTMKPPTERHVDDSEADSCGSPGNTDSGGRDGSHVGRCGCSAQVPGRSQVTPLGWALSLTNKVVRRQW